MREKRPLRRLILLITLAVIVAAAGWIMDLFYGGNPLPGHAPMSLTVHRGQTFTSIVDSLEARGLIRSRTGFEIVARVLGGAERSRVGRYTVPDGISNRDLFLMIRDGTGNLLIQVTIPEGLRSRSQARLLARAIGIDSAEMNRLVHDPDFIHSLGLDAPSLEGYLMPDTYGFTWQTEEKEVVRRLVDEFKGFFGDSLQRRARELGWTMNQAVTMASIVEGEAGIDEERARISGVYHNRLRKGMPLQADPTVQFFLEDGPRRVRYSDLRRDHPYNTYRRRGLPPGPVNNPGRASIVAALWPEKNPYLFFVANGSGGHWFTRTFAEHTRQARQYRRMRDARTGKSGTETTRPR